MSRVIGLDIATKTGWCVWDGHEYVTGVIDLSPTKNEPEGVRFLKAHRAYRYLLSDVDAAVIERTYSRGKRTAEILNGLTAIALSVLEESGTEYAFVDATSLKKFATGKGTAKKPDMVREAQRTLRSDNLTDDEADAFWLVRYWQDHMSEAA